MRHNTALMAALALPASAAAHSGPHDGMGLVKGIAHMLGQHYALGIAGALIAALLFLARLRARHTSDRRRRVCIDHKE